MCYLQREDDAMLGEKSLCQSLEDAYEDDRDFEFYVSKESQGNIHVPCDPYSLELRKKDPPMPNEDGSLWDLIVDGWFAKRPPMDKNRLVLGLMLSMDNNYLIDTWNPTSVFFLNDMTKNKLTLSIFIRRIEDNASQKDRLPMADHSKMLEGPQLLGKLIAMAKTLLGISLGERLETIKATGAYSELQRSRKTLRRTIYNRIQNATGKEPDLETLPLLEAAKRCLEFESQYTKLISAESSIVPIETAWQLIFKNILTTLDSSLTLPLEEPAQLSLQTTDDYTSSIRLFDGETGNQQYVGPLATLLGP